MNTQDGSPLGWTGWISLQSKGLSRVTVALISRTSKVMLKILQARLQQYVKVIMILEDIYSLEEKL